MDKSIKYGRPAINIEKFIVAFIVVVYKLINPLEKWK